jgi:hypothetical protein
MRTGSHAFPCSSLAELMHKYLSVNFFKVVSRPKLHFLSHGELGSPVSWVLNICWKCRLNIRTVSVLIVLSIFPYIIFDLQQKQVQHWKWLEIVYKQHGHFAFSFCLYAISGERGNTYKPACIYVCLVYKQTVTYKVHTTYDIYCTT